MEFPHMFNAIVKEWLAGIAWENLAGEQKSQEANTQHVKDEL